MSNKENKLNLGKLLTRKLYTDMIDMILASTLSEKEHNNENTMFSSY